MKRIIVLISLLVLFIIPGFSQEVIVSYVDGNVTVLEDGSWYDLFSGDTLEPDNVLKIGSNTVAEIEAAGRKIVLNKPGTYKMGELIEKSQNTASWGDSAVLKKFITGVNRAATKTAVMGVRGAAADSEGVEWLTEDNMVFSDAKEMIDSGNYRGAIELLLENRDDAFDEELSEYDFYLGKSYFLSGEPGKALSCLSKVEEDPAAEYYPDLVVMEGNLFLDSFSFNEALTVFDRYLGQDDVSETAQVVTYLSARALNALGEKAEAKNRLKKTVSMNPSSGIGQAAKSILDSF